MSPKTLADIKNRKCLNTHQRHMSYVVVFLITHPQQRGVSKKESIPPETQPQANTRMSQEFSTWCLT